jgi:hypothetical protein
MKNWSLQLYLELNSTRKHCKFVSVKSEECWPLTSTVVAEHEENTAITENPYWTQDSASSTHFYILTNYLPKINFNLIYHLLRGRFDGYFPKVFLTTC